MDFRGLGFRDFRDFRVLSIEGLGDGGMPLSVKP